MGQSESSGKESTDEIDEVKKCTAFSGDEVRIFYTRFQDEFPEGFITKEDFIKMYQQMMPDRDVSRFADIIFQAYDTDKNGIIDFKEFMISLSISSRGTIRQKMEWAFNMYDLNGDGVLTKSETAEILSAIYRMKGMKDYRSQSEIASLEIFTSLDKRHDDKLTLQEFLQGTVKSRLVLDYLDHDSS